ncbi:MAG: PEPxxWA-CTERM sorting domain-containing protein [Rhizomicrobium sp.]
MIIDGNGKLTGATGVAVGQLYNVEFVEGTCAGLFGGCNDSGDFTFNSSLLAFVAAEALLNQVFFDSALGQFDSNYALTFGCSDPTTALECKVLIPFGVSAANSSFVDTRTAINGSSFMIDEISESFLSTSFDTTTDSLSVYARFTLASAAVPEPASWAMMLMGFGAIGCSMRRRKVALAA